VTKGYRFLLRELKATGKGSFEGKTEGHRLPLAQEDLTDQKESFTRLWLSLLLTFLLINSLHTIYKTAGILQPAIYQTLVFSS